MEGSNPSGAKNIVRLVYGGGGDDGIFVNTEGSIVRMYYITLRHLYSIICIWVHTSTYCPLIKKASIKDLKVSCSANIIRISA